jgi:hypothetical protein
MLHRIITPLPLSMNPQGRGKPQPRIIEWIWKIIGILYWLEVGLLLLYLPWSDFWENNYLLYLYPQMRPVIANSYFKGFVLGLGIVNILIGINEVAQIKNRKDFFSP